MPFIEDHPNYKQYRIPTGLHFSDVPHKAWSEFKSLIDVAAGEDRELLVRVLSNLAKIARFGLVEPGLEVQFIPDVVSSIRNKVEAGHFNVFMDSLAVLCDEGELTIDDLSEYLECELPR